MSSSADVCVIGAGLIGVATAFYATKAGLRVVVLDQVGPAAGASGVATGGVSVSVFSYSAAEVPEQYVKLSLASLGMYRELAEELGDPLDFAAPGCIDPFLEPSTQPSRMDRVAKLRAAGVPAELVTGEDLRELEPELSSEVIGGIYCPVDGHVTPQAAVWALADGARRSGAEFRPRVAVNELIVRSGRAVGVKTSDGDLEAGCIVCCAGAGTPSILATAGASVPISHSRGQLFATERLPPLLRTHIHAIKQSRAGTIIIGAQREADVVDSRTTVHGTRSMLEWAVRVIPRLADVQVVRSWAGVRSVPADGMPVLGPAPGLDGLLVAVMHRGVTLGPIAGKILSELAATGSTVHDITLFDPGRFAGISGESKAEETFYALG